MIIISTSIPHSATRLPYKEPVVMWLLNTTVNGNAGPPFWGLGACFSLLFFGWGSASFLFVLFAWFS